VGVEVDHGHAPEAEVTGDPAAHLSLTSTTLAGRNP
jgi:hypothetical protein